MVGLATVTGLVPALLLLLAALLPGARVDSVSWSQCPFRSNLRVLDAGRDYNATALILIFCNITELRTDDFNRTALPNLTAISLRHNKLEYINPAVFIPVSHLNNSLILTGNKLRKVPVFGAHSLFPRLRELWLDNNHITSITENNTFASCAQLEELFLMNNDIEYIEPNVFKQLHNLRELVLYKNKIVSISETIFQIKSLEGLYVQDNLIEYVEPHAFRGTNLSSLVIHRNRLAFLPEHFASDLPALTGAYADGDDFSFKDNPWHCACLLELFADVKRLGVRYAGRPWEFVGTNPECVFLGRQACRRRAPSALLAPPAPPTSSRAKGRAI